MRRTFLSLLFISSIVSYLHSQNDNLKLWYLQPAKEWMESTPLGNGRLGAMVYGSLGKDIIALNEITMWSGVEDPYQENFCGKEILGQIRKEFFEGRIDKGNDLTSHFLAGTPHSFGTHLPIGDLNLSFDYDTTKVTDYKRDLNLKNAISNISFKIGKTLYKRDYLMYSCFIEVNLNFHPISIL